MNIVLDGITLFTDIDNFLSEAIGVKSTFGQQLSNVNSFAKKLAYAGAGIFLTYRALKTFMGDGAHRLVHDLIITGIFFSVLLLDSMAFGLLQGGFKSIQHDIRSLLSVDGGQGPGYLADNILNIYFQGALDIENAYFTSNYESNSVFGLGDVVAMIIKPFIWLMLFVFMFPGVLLAITTYVTIVTNEYLLSLLMIFGPLAYASFVFSVTRQIGMAWLNMIIAVMIKTFFYSLILYAVAFTVDKLISQSIRRINENTGIIDSNIFVILAIGFITGMIILSVFNKLFTLVDNISGSLANATVISSLVKESGGNMGQKISNTASQQIGKGIGSGAKSISGFAGTMITKGVRGQR